MINPVEDIISRSTQSDARVGHSYVRWVGYALLGGVIAISAWSVIGELVGLIPGLLLFMAYLLPALIAERRHHRNANAIAALNIFLGWTFIGWVGALVWALTADTETTVTD